MNRFVGGSILFLCVLAMPAARNAVAENGAAIPGRPVEKQNEEVRIARQVTESMNVASANTGAQSTRDLLPEGGVIIVSAADGYSWRVWNGGKIEFSYDSSHTWEVQKSGVTTDLTAGAAPSGKVCWVVGKAGTVLLTTDKGKHWKQLASPTKENLVGTFAQDGKRASVWTASHKQSFETNDGGVTWTANVEK